MTDGQQAAIRFILGALASRGYGRGWPSLRAGRRKPWQAASGLSEQHSTEDGLLNCLGGKGTDKRGARADAPGREGEQRVAI